MQIVSCEENCAKVKLAVRPHLLNGAQIVHGGVLFSPADYAFALAANAGQDSGLAINASISFIKAARIDDELFAEARLISRSRRLGTYQVTVPDNKGVVLALVQSTAYFK